MKTICKRMFTFKNFQQYTGFYMGHGKYYGSSQSDYDKTPCKYLLYHKFLHKKSANFLKCVLILGTII